MEKWREEGLTDKIIGACINVHKELVPGFLESIYHNVLIGATALTHKMVVVTNNEDHYEGMKRYLSLDVRN